MSVTYISNKEKLEELNKNYDKMQKKYGAKELDSICNGGNVNNPNICFVFMNPTGRNLSSLKTWEGIKSPWLCTKNIWKLFNKVNLFDDNLYTEILAKKPKDWDYSFAEKVYKEVECKKYFITNLGKCTQIDARALPDNVLESYLKLLKKEIDIIKPKVIITFGNQVSSIVIGKKISVSENRKVYYEKIINKNKYKIFPVYYPVGNGIFNMDKSVEDINWIIENYVK